MVKEVLIQEIEGEISDESHSVEEISQDCMGGNMYGSGLNNFAWVQAVQNKPLCESLVREFELNNRSTTNSNAKEVSNVVVTDDSNKVEEEVELEEGEIELEDDLMDKRIKLICHTLDTAVTVNEAEKSFDEIFTRLRTCLDSLGLIVSANGVSQVGDLIDKTFAAVNSVFKSKQHE